MLKKVYDFDLIRIAIDSAKKIQTPYEGLLPIDETQINNFISQIEKGTLDY
jgi:hypothetical protein